MYMIKLKLFRDIAARHLDILLVIFKYVCVAQCTQRGVYQRQYSNLVRTSLP